MRLHFLGANRQVTGSRHYLDVGDTKILIDCGMFQERPYLDRNWEACPVPADQIQAVILTHAHLDHCGLLPKLVREGFRGPVFTTPASADLAELILRDSAEIQAEDVAFKRKRHRKEGRRPKHPEVPLYTLEDVQHAMRRLEPIRYGQPVRISDSVSATFHDAGHILGSSIVEVTVSQGGAIERIVFTGDLGQWNKPILRDPTMLSAADFIVMESTYGDRDHEVSEASDKEAELAALLREGMARGGNIVIPSFAVGRTQEILYDISLLLEEKSVPGLETVPVYIDSPLGIAATQIFEDSSHNYYDEEATAYQAEGVKFFSFSTLVIAQTAEESKEINFDPRQKIIISSSGMCEAGRIKHHLKHNLWRADSTVLFVGYQAVGTLGRSILDGSKSVKIFGEEIQVKAAIEQLEGFSGHADQAGLLEWIGHFPATVERVFVMHGEESVCAVFAGELKKRGYPAVVPGMFETYDTESFAQVPAAAVREAEPAVDVLSLVRARLESADEAQAARMREDLLALLRRWEER